MQEFILTIEFTDGTKTTETYTANNVEAAFKCAQFKHSVYLKNITAVDLG